MGGGAVAPPGRIRIKGKTPSVVRFFFMSVSYTLVWLLISSELGYYSRLYGPQVLLQLNLAYYLPSIPVLLALGQLEKLLDSTLGATASMAARLIAGLLGCAALCAAFPFLPPRLGVLLGVTTAVGCVSAVAFSTSYQLVAWFRAADTIALGIGCVGSGPLALALQLALQMGSSPARWQWITLFEVAAGCVTVGALGAASLFGQYWSILASGESGSEGQREALLDAEEAGAEDEAEQAAQQLLLTPGMSMNLLMADPFQLPLAVMPGQLMPHLEAQLRSGQALRRAASADSDLSFADWRRQRAHQQGPGTSGLSSAATAQVLPRGHERLASASAGMAAAAAWRVPGERSGTQDIPKPKHALDPATLQRLPAAAAQLRGHLAAASGVDGSLSTSLPTAGPLNAMAAAAGFAGTAESGQEGGGSGGEHGGSGAVGARQCAAVLTAAIKAEAESFSAQDAGGQGGRPLGGCTAAWVSQHLERTGSGGSASSSAAPLARQGSVEVLGPVVQPGTAEAAQPATAPTAALTSATLAGRLASGRAHGKLASPFERVHGSSASLVDSLGPPSADGSPRKRRHGGMGAPGFEEPPITSMAVLEGTWMVYLGTTAAATLVNLIFPFFTYVPSSGWLGDNLPQVLFYSRIFADILGRLAPRRKALMLRAQGAMLALAGGMVALAGMFFVYIQAPPEWQWDPLAVALVVLIWLLAGYVNTNSYILAPALVEPRLVAKASALMALSHQVSHLLGLGLAVVLAIVLYGNISGDL